MLRQIREILRDLFRTRSFTTARIDNKFLLGTYDPSKSGLWKELRRGGFEPEETALVEKIVMSCDIFVDIGAHIGYYSCLSTFKNPKVKILAFEPNRKNFRNLLKNLELNKANYTAHNIGLSDKNGEVILYGDDSAGTINPTAHIVLPKDRQKVTIKKLDDFIDQFPKGSRVVVKIDAESHEYPILLGAQKFIEQVKPLAFLMENSREMSSGLNTNFQKTFDFMKERGYRREAINEGNFIFTSPAYEIPYVSS